MRLNFRRPPRPAPSADAQDRFWNRWEASANQPLSEISDSLDAYRHLSHKLQEAWTAGDQTEIRRLIGEGTRRFPREPLIRCLAADNLRLLGEDAEAMTHLAIVIALDPEFPNAYLRLARILHERGEREAALAVLEAGWKHRQRNVRRDQRAAEKARYFAILDRPLPVSGEQ